MTHPAKRAANPRPARKAAARDRPRGDQAELAMEVLQQFRLIFRSAKKHFQWVQEKSGISGAQLWVLAEVHRKPNLRVTELARAMAVHQSTASNLVEKLQKAGLLRREAGLDDRRVVRLVLTADGRATLQRAPGPVDGVLPDALKNLDAEDLTRLKRHLGRLIGTMQVHDRSGRKIPLSDI